MDRADRNLIADVGEHGAKEALESLKRITGNLPTGLRVKGLLFGLALLESKARALRQSMRPIAPTDEMMDDMVRMQKESMLKNGMLMELLKRGAGT